MKAFIKASKKLEVVDEKFAQFLHYRNQLKKGTKAYNTWNSVFPQCCTNMNWATAPQPNFHKYLCVTIACRKIIVFYWFIVLQIQLSVIKFNKSIP